MFKIISKRIVCYSIGSHSGQLVAYYCIYNNYNSNFHVHLH